MANNTHAATCHLRLLCLLGGLGSGQSRKAATPSWLIFLKQSVFVKAPVKSQELRQVTDPDSAFWDWEFWRSPFCCGLEWAAASHAFPKVQRKGVLCMAAKREDVNQSSRHSRQKLGRGWGRMEKKHQGWNTSGKQKLTNLLQFNPADPNTFTDEGQQVPWFKTKQSKIQSTSHTKANFWACPQPLIFQKDY